MQTLATHKTTIRTSQKHKTSRHLTRLARPAHRARELLLRPLVHRRRDQRRPDRARAHAVRADSVGDLLVRERAREGYDGALRGRVVHQVGPADVWIHGGAGYYGRAACEVRHGVFGEVEEGVDVGGEGVEPLFPVRFLLAFSFFASWVVESRLEEKEKEKENSLANLTDIIFHNLCTMIQY